MALVFYVLEQTIGNAAMRTFLKSLTGQHAWQKCVTIEDLSRLMHATTNSATAGKHQAGITSLSDLIG